MKLKYNHWYECKPGQMPEDFPEMIVPDMSKACKQHIVTWDGDHAQIHNRYNIDGEWGWYNAFLGFESSTVIAWQYVYYE